MERKTSACRNTGGRVDQAAQRTGDKGDRMRQALVARVVNRVSGEAWAGTANLIYHHGRISGCSGILFEKKIERNTRAAGNARIVVQKVKAGKVGSM